MRSANLSVAIGLCMLLGTHTALSRAEDPKPADVIAEIRMLGGTVETDQNDPENPVVKIILNGTKVTDNHLEKLKVFPKLRSLGVNNTAITDEGVEHLKALKSLQTLNIFNTKTTDKSLEHVKELPELRILVVCGNPVTDSGLEQLKGMTNLKHVYIYATKITGNGAKKLRAALPGAKIEGE
jgi:hypothetical protein